jgi:hypothetical protein
MHLESFEMWCCRRTEISWTDHVRNEEVLLGVKEQRNILYEISKQKANWIGHILRWNCLIQQVIEGKIKGRIKVTGKWGRCRKLLGDLKKRRRYSHLKEEALDCSMWELTLEEALDLSWDRLLNEWITSEIRIVLTVSGFKSELSPNCNWDSS